MPEYEVVKINHRIHKRSSTTILRARAFNQDKTLYLEPTEGLLIGEKTKVWTAKSNFRELVYTEVKNVNNFYYILKRKLIEEKFSSIF